MALDKIITKWEIDTSDAQKETKKVESNIKDVEAQSKKSASGISSSFKALGGVLVAAFAFNEILGGIKNVIQLNAEFEKSLDNLQAITGATNKEMAFYREQAIGIAKDNRLATVSASEFTESLKLIGSARPELLQNKEALVALTKEAIILSQASGDDLVTSATNLGDALNFMRLPAEEASRVMNVLAAASQKGSKEIPYVNEALSKFGGVAASAGISIETSAAAIETLGKVIPEASTAGNNLRNIITILQVEADKAGRPFQGLQKELEIWGSDVDNVTRLTNVFGRENLLAAQTLITQRNSLQELEKSITGTNTAYEQAAINTDNLSSNYERLQNAIASIVLSEGGRFNEFLNSTVKFLIDLVNNSEPVTSAFGEMFDMIGELGDEFASLLTELGLVNEETNTAGGLMTVFGTAIRFIHAPAKLLIEGLTYITKGLRSVKDSIKPVADSIKEFASGLLNTLAPALEFLGFTTDEAAKKNKNFQASQKEVAKESKKTSEQLKKEAEDEKAKLQELAKERADNSEKEKKRREKEAEERKKDNEKLLDDIAKMKAQQIENEKDRAIALLRVQKEKEIQSIEQSKASEATKAEAIKLINESLQSEILKIESDYEKKKQKEIEKNIEDEISLIQDGGKRRLKELELQLLEKGATENEIETELLGQRMGLLAQEIEQRKELGLESIDQELELKQIQKDIKDKEASDDLAREKMLSDAKIALGQIGIDAAVQATKLLTKNVAAQKGVALAEIAFNQAVAISELVKDTQKIGITPIEKAVLFGTGLVQILGSIAKAKDILNSAKGYKEGIIDLPGVGTGTSDSNLAWLSKGETVTPADRTKQYKPILQSIHDGNFDDYITKTRILPLIKQLETRKTQINDMKIAEMFDDSRIVKGLAGLRKDGKQTAREFARELARYKYFMDE